MAKQKEAREKLSKYVEGVKQKTKEDLKINEENTIVKFILPLFGILEWDQSSDDVDYQHTIKDAGRADIILKINSNPVAIIEAKRFNTDLSDRHMQQAMRYKTRARWAIITNGRELRVYDWRFRQKRGREFFKLSYDAFTKHFDLLWLLSRYRMHRLDLVSNKYMEWEKLIRERAKRTKNAVLKDFIKDALKEDGAKYRLIGQAISETRRIKV
jgi:type I site-specific restriction endonuclease